MPQDAPNPAPLTGAELSRVDDLERKLARIEAQFADLQLSWAETLDKLSAWANRQATRDRRALQQRLEPDPEPVEETPPPAAAPAAPSKAELRARLAALQRKAM